MSYKYRRSKSKINGYGIFATKDIKKGEIAFIAKGKIVKFVVKTPKDSEVGPNWMGITDVLWLDPSPNNGLMYINHSCNPTLGVKGRVTFVALRNIKKGEELTVDYSIIGSDPFWKMKCSCGSKQCRKIIRSIQFLSPKELKQYTPLIPRYFEKVYYKMTKTQASNG